MHFVMLGPVGREKGDTGDTWGGRLAAKQAGRGRGRVHVYQVRSARRSYHA